MTARIAAASIPDFPPPSLLPRALLPNTAAVSPVHARAARRFQTVRFGLGTNGTNAAARESAWPARTVFDHRDHAVAPSGRSSRRCPMIVKKGPTRLARGSGAKDSADRRLSRISACTMFITAPNELRAR